MPATDPGGVDDRAHHAEQHPGGEAQEQAQGVLLGVHPESEPEQGHDPEVEPGHHGQVKPVDVQGPAGAGAGDGEQQGQGRRRDGDPVEDLVADAEQQQGGHEKDRPHHAVEGAPVRVHRRVLDAAACAGRSRTGRGDCTFGDAVSVSMSGPSPPAAGRVPGLGQSH
jgi:hypothetical protein